KAVATDAPLVAERAFQRVAELQCDVLDRVMLVDVEIAAALDLEREAAVLAELLEHVIEEADARLRDGLGLAVEVDFDADVGLARLALDHCGPRPVEQHVLDVRPGGFLRAALRDDEAGDADVLGELEILRSAADDRGAFAVEHARSEELADQRDAGLAAAAALVRAVRADQRRRERDALRREKSAKVGVRAL